MRQANEKAIRRAGLKQRKAMEAKQVETIRNFLYMTRTYNLYYRLMIAGNIIFKRYKKM